MGNKEVRFHAVATVKDDIGPAYQGGPSHKAGSTLCLTTVTKNSSGNLIHYLTPSPTALALSIAIKASKKAIKLHQAIDFVDIPDPDGLAKMIKDNSLLFDYFEYFMVVVTFSLQALEVFCNDMIAKKLKGKYRLQQGNKIKKLSAHQLQRQASIEIKLKTILPEILEINSPEHKKVWENFKELKRIRNTIIHLKAHESYTNKIDEETLFYEFFMAEADKFPRFALEMIDFFSDSKEVNPWLESYRKQIFNTVD